MNIHNGSQTTGTNAASAAEVACWVSGATHISQRDVLCQGAGAGTSARAQPRLAVPSLAEIPCCGGAGGSMVTLQVALWHCPGASR